MDAFLKCHWHFCKSIVNYFLSCSVEQVEVQVSFWNANNAAAAAAARPPPALSGLFNTAAELKDYFFICFFCLKRNLCKAVSQPTAGHTQRKCLCGLCDWPGVVGWRVAAHRRPKALFWRLRHGKTTTSGRRWFSRLWMRIQMQSGLLKGRMSYPRTQLLSGETTWVTPGSSDLTRKAFCAVVQTHKDEHSSHSSR